MPRTAARPARTGPGRAWPWPGGTRRKRPVRKASTARRPRRCATARRRAARRGRRLCAWRPRSTSKFLHVRALRWLEVKDVVLQALVDLRAGKNKFVYVALRVGDHARHHRALFAHHEHELRDAGDRLDRRQFERVVLLLRLEFLQEVALAPQEGEGAGELISAEAALHLHFVVLGAEDPERVVLHVEDALVGLLVIPAYEAGLLHAHGAFGVLGAPHRDVGVVLLEAGGEIGRAHV